MLPQFRPLTNGFLPSRSVQAGTSYAWKSPSGALGAAASGIAPAAKFDPGKSYSMPTELGSPGLGDPGMVSPSPAGSTPADPTSTPGFGFSAPSRGDVASVIGSGLAGAAGLGGLSGPAGALAGYAAGNSGAKSTGQAIGSGVGFLFGGPIGSALFGYLGGKIGGSFDESGLADGRVGGPTWGGTIGPGPFAAPYNYETTIAPPDVPVTAEELAAPWSDPDAIAGNNSGAWGGGDENSGNWSAGGGSFDGSDGGSANA